MAVTTSGWTYAVNADPLINWPGQSLAVATKLEQRLPGGSGASRLPFAMNVGAVTITPVANTITGVAVTFASGRFNVTPNVYVAANSGSAALRTATYSAASDTGVTINIFRTDTVSTTVSWQAIQMTSTSAAG